MWLFLPTHREKRILNNFDLLLYRGRGVAGEQQKSAMLAFNETYRNRLPNHLNGKQTFNRALSYQILPRADPKVGFNMLMLIKNYFSWVMHKSLRCTVIL